ncbi:NAD(P)H-dependent flavin oxidoreductase [Burkholderia multivorans]|uniref:NAD(P)H-dependent flavin oxidoreductase n=1 Tax=Burkholderia multivorans TaxID=87883 RepID=UPI002019112D|nr:nitronate monooxygenase [Burkholderia multivorans]MCO1367049.1 nitronate monooxygenase [Burkholderia multivorans]MCO1376658.1 nitronate monooxygenase [Burkholderia multivorans]UQP18610.1 nitronate monooxygenase [Burkholderia multivorans]UQP86579.1 nitronate monooxygenase [Burkholderia multivorans]
MMQQIHRTAMQEKSTAVHLRELFAKTRLPIMAAPMFLVSSPELVIASSRAGIVGTYAAPNARNVATLDEALGTIADGVVRGGTAPWALNMIVHSSYDRFDAELELVRRYRPKIVTTALGSPRRVLEHVHGYGGFVMADVSTPAMARKAVDAGVDGLILVCSGAGGHTGTYHPFSFVDEVRRFWRGPLGLAGAVSTGAHTRAALQIGADFAVLGTRFIAAEESMAQPAYRDMLVESSMEDLVASKAVSGVLANWLRPTLDRAGLTAAQLGEEKKIDFSGDISTAPKAWKDVWSAGHGVGAVTAVEPLSAIVDRLADEYAACLSSERDVIERLARQVKNWKAAEVSAAHSEGATN